MSSGPGQSPSIWKKAVEHVEGLSGTDDWSDDPSRIEEPVSLVVALSEMAALSRLNLPAALYDATGQRCAGPESFPDRLTPGTGGRTWTMTSADGDLLLCHPVELEAGRRILCAKLDAVSLHLLLPNSEPLTRTEFAVLARLMHGESVRRIAEADGVSYNTRRRQTEALIEKLGVHSQIEAVRIAFLAVVDTLLGALSSGETRGPGIDPLARTYGDAVRFHWIELSGGDPMRVVEFGDPAGRPVLLFHPLLFPCGVTPFAAERLRHSGLRIISPLRPGFFDSPPQRAALKPQAVVADWSRRVDALLGFLNLASVDVVSIAMAAVWATDFAVRMPSRVASLTFLSAPQPSAVWRRSLTTSFIHSLSAIVDRAPWMAEPFVRLHSVRVRDLDSATSGFRKTFRKSAADLAEIDKLASERMPLEVAVSTLREAVPGIATDLRMASHPWDTHLAAIDAPLRFVHGDLDPLCRIEHIRSLVTALPHADLREREGDGHLFYLRGFQDALSRSFAQ